MDKFVYTEEVTGEIVQIPVKLLHHHHDNPRKDLGDLTELTDSIRAKGVLQNLTVVPYWFKISGVGCDDPKQQAEMGYLVVIGNRRLEAAKKAGLDTLPCIIAKMTPAEQLQTMLLENMQRSDLTAYEQAQGFQMMIDFGDTIDQVAEKTGFSKTTIRRRLEWAKLDADTMTNVSDRQILFADLDKLSQIENIETRNKVLCEIGTNNFENKLREAVKAQEDGKRQAKWREMLIARGFIEIPMNAINDYNKYTWCDTSYIDMTQNDVEKFDDKFSVKEGIQYYFAFQYGCVYFRKEKPTSENLSREQEERKRQEAERNVKRKEFEDLFNRAYDLRVSFVESLSETAIKKKSELIITTIIRYDWTPGYRRTEEQAFADMMGVNLPKGGKSYEMVKDATEANPYKALLSYALYLIGEDEDECCNDYTNFYRKNETLEQIYEILCDLGYQMSDEEKALLDGTHDLYEADPDNDDEDDDYEDDDYEEEDEEEDDNAAIEAALDEEGASYDE